jgi:hypothetical protein
MPSGASTAHVEATQAVTVQLCVLVIAAIGGIILGEP